MLAFYRILIIIKELEPLKPIEVVSKVFRRNPIKIPHPFLEFTGLHREVISNTDIQKIVYLKGEHYLHWKQSEAIAELLYDYMQQ